MHPITPLFDQLTDWLREHRPLWESPPFEQWPQATWAPAYPALYQAARELTEPQLENLENDTDVLLAWAEPHLPGIQSLYQPSFSQEPETTTLTWPPSLINGIPGRKLAQIDAFITHQPLQSRSGITLDWCAGKAHLGRLFSHHHQHPVIALECDQTLVEAGNRLSSQWQIDCIIQHQDVLAPDLEQQLPKEPHHTLALHACGDLHRRLIELTCAQTSGSLSLAPCCYHKQQDAHYQPLSRHAQQQDLGLHRQHLQLAVAQETVVASAAEVRRRQTLKQWRLGFDLLQRSLGIREHYLPLPSCNHGKLREGFPAFCQWGAEYHRFTLPSDVVWQTWLDAANERLAQIRREELVRHLFRRPLEYWLVIDRVLALHEAGLQVELKAFCARGLTPRNLLINAWREN